MTKERIKASFQHQANQHQELVTGAWIIMTSMCKHGNIRINCQYQACTGEQFN